MNNLDPIQEIRAPPGVGPNESSIPIFTRACDALATEELAKSVMIYAQNCLRLTDADRSDIIQTVILQNAEPIATTEITSLPSHAEFLETHRVPYRIFDQRPGDIVYLLPGTYHSVINLTPDLAEAINYGDARWNNFAHLLTKCSCPDINYTVLAPNPDIHNTLITRRLPVYPWQIDGCEFASRDIPSFASHMNTSHDQPLPNVPEGYKYCFVCDKAFNASNMARHVSSGPHRKKKAALLSTYRSKPAYGLKQCEYCLTYVIEVEYSDHLNHCSRKPHSCLVCTMAFVWLDNLAKHMARAHPEVPYKRERRAVIPVSNVARIAPGVAVHLPDQQFDSIAAISGFRSVVNEAPNIAESMDLSDHPTPSSS
ncbi:hypothetical protein QAD02_010861 [Eretmocerus hayati]|uniref:Uncharacterized protein n=1 Tax=Eretmocerus hayati TaxID=131215 RepID=A0ACC2NZV3_9HYME|nr:hypothetical protein QAD02_010861 [Eretmocerus hayati]